MSNKDTKSEKAKAKPKAETKPKAKARFITPPNRIKEKVGSGGIDPKIFGRAQEYMDTINFDYAPMAKELLKKYFAAINDIKEDPYLKADEKKENVLIPLMQLKETAGMFRYPLISTVADIGIQFLECIEGVNKEALSILIIHHSTLQGIVSHDLKGDGGEKGYTLIKELDQACRRYFDKHGKT